MVIGDFWVGPDCPGLQHQLHIIVPFLLLVPSVLLLPDVICFSNLDAQTQQEPHTHTQIGCLANTDFSTCSSNIRCANKCAVSMHPFIWDLHPSATCVINLTLLCTAGIKLYEDQPARSSPIQMNSLLYIPLTSVTLPPRKYQSQDMHIAGRPWLQTVIIKSTGFLLKTPDRLAGRRNWSEHQTVNIIVRNKRENDERCICVFKI